MTSERHTAYNLVGKTGIDPAGTSSYITINKSLRRKEQGVLQAENEPVSDPVGVERGMRSLLTGNPMR